MCGRFVQAQPASVYARYFGADDVATEAPAPSYNVAPTDQVFAVAEHDDRRLLGAFRWGLIPWWAKEKKIGARNINARSESVASKPSFRDSFQQRRCLIPADGFYEWERKDKGKLPHYIYASDGHPLALAGLWATWRDPEDENIRLRTCTVITGVPNDRVAGIHDRMPVILPADSWDAWLDRNNTDVDELQSLLGVYPSGALSEHAVSTLVNSVANNVPELIEPLTTPAAGHS